MTYPAYSVDWVLPTNFARGADGRRPGGDPELSISRQIQVCVELLIDKRNPWKFLNNSCHMDCWLMLELSCFGAIAQNTLLLTNSFIAESPSLSKLFRVLLSAGDTDEQDRLKMAYWAMEIEDYHGGAPKFRKTFGLPIQYGEHSMLLDAYMRKDVPGQAGEVNSHDLLNTYVGLTPVCTNPAHSNIAPIHKRRQVLTIAEHWYSMPHDWTRVRLPNNEWRYPTCTYIPHKNFADVVGSILGRTDGETIECKSCFANTKKTYQITFQKNPAVTLLPLFLDFEMDPSLSLSAERILVVGDTRYILMGVVFGNGSHFKCNVYFKKTWYHYDSCGQRSKTQTDNDRMPTLPRMTRISMIHHTSYMTPPEANKEYHAISFRYIRKQIDTLGLEAVDGSGLPLDLQFNNMSRLNSV
jgi:hypothetical protein